MFRCLISILTIGLISTAMNTTAAVPNKTTLTYAFDAKSYGSSRGWGQCPFDGNKTMKNYLVDPLYTTWKNDPVVQYFYWVQALNSDKIVDPDELNAINDLTLSFCDGLTPKHNPTLASTFNRLDGYQYCQNYTKPEFDKTTEITIKTRGARDLEFYSGSIIIPDEGATYFLEAYKDVFPKCFSNGKKIRIIEISSANKASELCSIEKVACSKFFKSSGGNISELHRGLIELLASTSANNKISNCFIYLAVDDKAETNKYAYNDASLSWNLVKEIDGYYQILDDPKATGPGQVKKLTDTFLEKERFSKGDPSNLDLICSDEQALALLDRKFVTLQDVTNDNFKELLKHTSGQLLVGKYANDILKEEENNDPDGSGGGSGTGGGQGTTAPTSCVEPSPDGFTIVEGNNTISLKTKCEDVCKNLSSITVDEQKRCNKRCLKERKGYSYSYEKNNSTTSNDVKFQEQGIVFSNFKNADNKSYEQALLDYDACLVSIGKKMSKEKKWETGLTTGGMLANLFMGAFGMYSTSSMNDDNFMLQVAMLRKQDQCYSLNPEQSVISNTKKRSFFGWIFSGMKSTFKEEQPYKKLSEVDATTYNNLKKTYSIKNPVTRVTEDMTAYDICVLNKALSSMNQTMQNQMLCNQLMGMGIINQREYKACMMGKDLKYGTGGNTPFAKGAEKEKPIPAPEEKEKKEEEPKKDDKPAGTTPAGGGTPGSTPSASNKETPDYMRNYPYYKSSNRGGGNLGYSDGKQPYYGGGDAGTAGQNSVDLKAGTGTGADAGTAGNFLIDNLPGINSTTYNSISSGRKQQ